MPCIGLKRSSANRRPGSAASVRSPVERSLSIHEPSPRCVTVPMTHKERDRRERHVRVHLRMIIDATNRYLRPEDLWEVEEFIEHYEFGCAFDLLVAVIATAKAPLDKETFDRIHSLAGYMRLESGTRLDELTVTES